MSKTGILSEMQPSVFIYANDQDKEGLVVMGMCGTELKFITLFDCACATELNVAMSCHSLKHYRPNSVLGNTVSILLTSSGLPWHNMEGRIGPRTL